MKYILFYIDHNYNIIFPRRNTHFEEIISFDKILYANGTLGSYFPKNMNFLDRIIIYDEIDFTEFISQYKKKDIIFFGSLELIGDVETPVELFNLFNKHNVTIHHSYCFSYGYEIKTDVKYIDNIKNINIDSINRDITINEILT